MIEGEPWRVAGVNSRAELAVAEARMAARAAASGDGRGRDPDRPRNGLVRLRHQLGRDVTVEPNVVFGPGVERSPTARGSAPSAISRARRSATSAKIGPFARLRPGTELGERREGRQFRRGQESDARRRAPRPTICPISAMPRSAPRPISAPARSPAITTASSSTGPRSAKAPSSARTPRWSRR